MADRRTTSSESGLHLAPVTSSRRTRSGARKTSSGSRKTSSGSRKTSSGSRKTSAAAKKTSSAARKASSKARKSRSSRTPTRTVSRKGTGAGTTAVRLGRLKPWALAGGVLLCGYITLALAGYHGSDPGFSRTGSGTVQNMAGPLGALVADLMLQVFGWGSALVVPAGLAMLWRLAGRSLGGGLRVMGAVLGAWALLALLALIFAVDVNASFPKAGLVGLVTADSLSGLVGPAGAWLVSLAALGAGLVAVFRADLERLADRGVSRIEEDGPRLGRLGWRFGRRAVANVATAAQRVGSSAVELLDREPYELDEEDDSLPGLETGGPEALEPELTGHAVPGEPELGPIPTPTVDQRERFSAFTPSPLGTAASSVGAAEAGARTQAALPALAEVEWEPTQAGVPAPPPSRVPISIHPERDDVRDTQVQGDLVGDGPSWVPGAPAAARAAGPSYLDDVPPSDPSRSRVPDSEVRRGQASRDEISRSHASRSRVMLEPAPESRQRPSTVDITDAPDVDQGRGTVWEQARPTPAPATSAPPARAAAPRLHPDDAPEPPILAPAASPAAPAAVAAGADPSGRQAPSSRPAASAPSPSTRSAGAAAASPDEDEATGPDEGQVIRPHRAEPRAARPELEARIEPGNLVSGGDESNGIAVIDASEHTPFELPHMGLLDFHLRDVAQVDEAGLRELGRILEEKLADFGVNGEVRAIRPGPVITTFEYLPAPGVKISKIAGLADDIAMALKALRVRIVAPIPGKGVVGIEIPNKARQTVWIRDILASETYRAAKMQLPMALGKSVEGKPTIVDLAKMPHLLVGGTTGSGKSVGINAMLVTMLYARRPEELKFIMIDPKMLEFELYQDIPHLLHPVVTEPKLASAALKWACEEMDERYRLLARWKTRNIVSYNKRVEAELEDWSPEKARKFKPRKWDVETQGEYLPEKLPYIVVVIDELADLMMAAAKDVEESIIRLAQKARAAGIHLIVATQRPSVNVITGLIKANMPSRISFQVRTKVDSRTILDQNGAENLLGMGDMLYLPPGVGAVERCHGAYVSDEEARRVTDFLREQQEPEYGLELDLGEDGPDGVFDDEEYDEFYDEAVAFVASQGKASTSMVQRRFKIGYNRAARIIDCMEREGVIGPADGARPRKVLVPAIDE